MVSKDWSHLIRVVAICVIVVAYNVLRQPDKIPTLVSESLTSRFTLYHSYSLQHQLLYIVWLVVCSRACHSQVKCLDDSHGSLRAVAPAFLKD